MLAVAAIETPAAAADEDDEGIRISSLLEWIVHISISVWLRAVNVFEY